MFEKKPYNCDPWLEENPITAKITKILSWINQPITIVFFSSVIFYSLVSLYYFSYFGRLSLPFFILSLPLSFYQDAGRIIFCALFFILASLGCLYTLPFLQKFLIVFSKYSRALMLLFLAVIYLRFIMGMFVEVSPEMELSEYSTIISLYLFIAFIGICIEIIIPVLHRKHFHSSIHSNMKNIFFIMLLITSAASILITIDLVACHAAEELIRGETGFEVRLSLDNNSTLFNKTFMLITECNGNYYLIEKCNPVPTIVTSYVIPEKRINEISIKKRVPKDRQAAFDAKVGNLTNQLSSRCHSIWGAYNSQIPLHLP